jgi:2,4-dienoyl-CoA reductase-like NADH-dependent reductase (Old Yellow Enzyme family)
LSALFSPLAIRGARLPNRIGVAPMCQYRSADGRPDHWQLVHLGARAVGGAGLVLTEATAVCPEGRSTPYDTGLWCGTHVDAWRPVTAFIAAQGAVPAVQLAHAGPKAATRVPWTGRGGLRDSEGGWQPVGPDERPHARNYRAPRALDRPGVTAVVDGFAAAAERAVAAGFTAVEIHAAHGQLLQSFLSPLSNSRTDAYGGDLDGRARLLREVVRGVRRAIGDEVALLTRISATDWAPDGWTVADSVALVRQLAADGVDLVDCSAGGTSTGPGPTRSPGYQVGFAARVRRDSGLPTATVGLITEPGQAEQVVATGEADVVLLGRELLRDPYWPLRAAAELGAPMRAPAPYCHAF